MTVRVRFAPSPTGYLHVGGARTALYNWLFARHHGGQFILRIEDTDRKRSTEDAIHGIIDSMSWLGLDWDESLTRQTDKLDDYLAKAGELVEEGKAYFCYCSPEELQERRSAAKLKGTSPAYDRRCRELPPEKEAAYRSEGRKPSIRIKMQTKGETVVADLIRGRVVFNNAELDDLIIMRPDSIPTYNFASVIDDVDMRITHVIRGEDHLSNTPRQMQIYRALGAQPPFFAHLSMILGEDKTPLSKRHGAASVEAFREEGYLPDALINFLALLGWAWDDHTTIFSVDELIERFTLDKVTKSPAVFDTAKLDWMNGHYIRELSDDVLTHELIHVWRRAGLLPAEKIEPQLLEKLKAIARICRERLVKLTDVILLTDFFFAPVVPEAAAIDKALRQDGAAKILRDAGDRLSGLDSWTTEKIEEALRAFAADSGQKPRLVFQPIRVAVSGRLVSPPLFESLEILGQNETLRRLSAAEQFCQT